MKLMASIIVWISKLIKTDTIQTSSTQSKRIWLINHSSDSDQMMNSQMVMISIDTRILGQFNHFWITNIKFDKMMVIGLIQFRMISSKHWIMKTMITTRFNQIWYRIKTIYIDQMRWLDQSLSVLTASLSWDNKFRTKQYCLW